MGRHSAPSHRRAAEPATAVEGARQAAPSHRPAPDPATAVEGDRQAAPSHRRAAELVTAVEGARQAAPSHRRAAEPATPVPAAGRLVRGGVYAVVTGLLLAGCIAFTGLDKTVSMVIDGQTRTVSTYAVTVADLAEETGVPIGARDAVSPVPTANTRDGSTVTVVHARPITLDVDGKPRTVWVAALTVDEAMTQLGYAQAGAQTTASRSTRLTAGQTLVVRLPKTFTVTADGTTRTLTSAEPTVGQALQRSNVGLTTLDRVSVPRATRLTAGAKVTVQRVAVKNISEKRAIPFATTTQPDPATYVGIDTPAVTGQPGAAVVTVRQVWVDGVLESAKDVATSVTVKPVTAVVNVGAKPFPAEVNALNWFTLGTCESTNNPKAMSASGTYTGEYQFSDATWQSVGGTGRSMDASPAEQLARAKMLYIRSGAGQWECGSRLSA